MKFYINPNKITLFSVEHAVWEKDDSRVIINQKFSALINSFDAKIFTHQYTPTGKYIPVHSVRVTEFDN